MGTLTSSSSSFKRWKYDVYLSFQGEDTRKNFTHHLYFALKDAGFNVFIDGQVSLENDLNQAIEGSKIAVIVFSRRYVESSWCLDELAKIMECRRTLGQLVFPIFYDVDPSDVRNQTGSYATAFRKHEQRPQEEVKEKLPLWRNALTEAAQLFDPSLRNADGYEGRFIREIVTRIIRVLDRSTCLAIASYQVGIDSRMQDIDNLLDVGESNDVRRIGIWGMGGMGKTTVAKAIFNKYQDRFEGKSFLQNVRKMKLEELQEQLLFDILKPANTTYTKVSCVDEGIHEIKRRLHYRRVLVIVDDIDHMKQFEALAIKYDSFGPGSRIIITTRDQHLLKILKVDKIYKLPAMNREEAFQLLSWHAFRKNCPNIEHLQVSRKAVDYCGGLPLALKVLGSYLFGRSTSEWKSALEKLKFHPHREILGSLKISFDELHDYELNTIFLDVSCFFTGMNKDYVMKILDGCDLCPEIGITVLQERCLVTIDHNLKLVMPDLLRDMGREIVRSESSEPGERSRLWHHDDVIDVLRNKSGTEAIQGLTLDLQESDKFSFSTEAFRNMRSLRLLKLNYVNLTGSYDTLSNELRWLCWHGFPLEVIPKDFDHPNMVAIDLSYSKLIRVWEDSDRLLEKLKFLNLSHSHYLTQSPDFSKLPNLEQLILQDCKCLLHVDQSIGQLQKLVLVDLKDCKLLRDLPESFYKLSSVQTLDLAGCSKFKNLAEDLGEMASLTTLIADNTDMKSIPTSIFRLKNLNSLSLYGLKWPLSTNPLRPSLSGLSTLRVLSLAGCNLTGDPIPMELVSLNFLEHLDLQGNSFCSLPTLSGISKLEKLCLNDCTKLRAIPDLPTSLEILEADECITLEKMPDFSEMSRIRVLHLNHSPKLSEIPGLHNSLNSMTRIHMEGCTNLTADFRKKILQGWTSCGYGGIFLNGNYIPEWFRYFGGDEVCIEAHRSVNSNFKGLTLCCVYSSNKKLEDCPLGISIRNETKHTALLARITYASVPTSCDSEDHYLWQGQLSSDVFSWQDGDEVKISIRPIDISVDVEYIAVDPVWDKFMKENMDDSHPGLYDLYSYQDNVWDKLMKENMDDSHTGLYDLYPYKDYVWDKFMKENMDLSHRGLYKSYPYQDYSSIDNDDASAIIDDASAIIDDASAIIDDGGEAGPSNDSSGENQTPKRLRPDPGSTACELMKMASSSSSKCSKYDVFLSFRGETRKSLTDDLYCTLKDRRFKVFIDEKELSRGEIFTQALKQAVKDSRLAAIIFSSGYAESRWCLDELVEILACRRTMGQMVLPIFYDIDPSDVRHQKGAFAKAFQRHQERFPEMVQTWKDALNEAAGLAGEDFGATDGHHGKFVQKIADKITRKLKNTYLDVAPYPIGIDSRVQEIGNYLDVGGSNNVCIIGIWGMGGLGKTTVAKAIYNKYQDMFEGASFLPNVREQKLVKSQNKLLSDVLRSGHIKVRVLGEGIEDIKTRFGNLKALVIIDDVDSVKQLTALAIKRETFGPGSKIFITTRNKHLLEILKPDKICHLPAMNKEEALELLSWYAFGEKYPTEEYAQVSREVVEHCGGLPLALQVLGSYLRAKSTSEWESALGKWKRSRPFSAIHKRLKISYDGLTDDDVKSMFLDISCFFIGMNKDYVMKILDQHDCNTIRELHDQCLVTFDTEGNLMMHGLIRDTGREIVREKSPNILGRRCRLWDHEDVKRVLRTNTGREEIEGLTLDLSERHMPFSTEAFTAMHGLRLLKLKGVKFTGHCEHLFKHLFKELRWLCWPECPVEVIPGDFNQTNLVDMDLSHSNIQVWEDSDVPLEKLKFLNLGYCKHLERWPDFSKIPNLERLILEGCTILSEIHSIVRLINLKYLSLANCNLADNAIPQDLGALSSLEVLDARRNGFNCLPILRRLSKLQTLHLNNCTNLQEIPDLPTNLEILEADECIALDKMPDFSEMSRMRELHLNHSPELTGILGLENALNSMTRIHMERCTNLTADFKKAILQGWCASGNGGLFLPVNEIPSWFTPVDPQGEIVVPQSFGCDLKALAVCIIYSLDDSKSGSSLRIRVANCTQNTEFLISPMRATVMTPHENYLWMGHLSNSKLSVKGGDKINVGAHFVGPATNDIHLRVKKIGVNLEKEKLINEYTLDCQSMPYSSECKEDGNRKAGHSDDLSHENQSHKRLRTDPSVERNAEEETDEIIQEGSSMGQQKKKKGPVKTLS